MYRAPTDPTVLPHGEHVPVAMEGHDWPAIGRTLRTNALYALGWPRRHWHRVDHVVRNVATDIRYHLLAPKRHWYRVTRVVRNLAADVRYLLLAPKRHWHHVPRVARTIAVETRYHLLTPKRYWHHVPRAFMRLIYWPRWVLAFVLASVALPLFKLAEAIMPRR